MKTNVIRKGDELFSHGSHLKYIALAVLMAIVAQSLMIVGFLLFNGLDL